MRLAISFIGFFYMAVTGEALSWTYSLARLFVPWIGMLSITVAFKAGERDVAEFWLDMGPRKVHVRYFAVRSPEGTYLGTLETVQDVTPEIAQQFGFVLDVEPMGLQAWVPRPQLGRDALVHVSILPKIERDQMEAEQLDRQTGLSAVGVSAVVRDRAAPVVSACGGAGKAAVVLSSPASAGCRESSMQDDPLYHDGMRRLQDARETRKLADRLAQVTLRARFTDEDRAFIEQCSMLFVATADAGGHPDCSYKGGLPGFVRVLDEHTLALPDYDGGFRFCRVWFRNGMAGDGGPLSSAQPVPRREQAVDDVVLCRRRLGSLGGLLEKKVDLKDLAVMGFVEVLSRIRFFLKLRNRVL